MKRCWAIWGCGVLAAVALCSCRNATPQVVAGTTLIQAVVSDVAGPGLSVRSLIPGGMCPGHFDVRPGDVDAVARSKALIIHPWQRQMGNVQGVIRAAKAPEARVKVADVTGNWMVPMVQEEAVTAVARLLGEIEPAMADAYGARAAARCETIRAESDRLAQRLEAAGVAGVKVLCSEQQVPLAAWAGLDVVATYGRPEEMSVEEVERLVREGREGQVVLVVDNLQSGETSLSETLARDLGAVQVVLSNFPGAWEDTETWEKALGKNVDLLLDAVERGRKTHA